MATTRCAQWRQRRQNQQLTTSWYRAAAAMAAQHHVALNGLVLSENLCPATCVAAPTLSWAYYHDGSQRRWQHGVAVDGHGSLAMERPGERSDVKIGSSQK